jgi:hypothetical protein
MEPITEYLDTPAIHAIAANYGKHLERVPNSQKLKLIGILALWVSSAINEYEDDAEEVHWSELDVQISRHEAALPDILNQCNDLAPDEALVFIEAIANVITV